MTSLEGILYHSKQIIKCKDLLLKLRQTLTSACTLKHPLPSHDSLKILILETNRRIEEHNQPVKIMMTALLTGKGYDFSGREMAHLSSRELKDGYAFLENEKKETTHVLFLRNYKDIQEGQILAYEQCESFLADISQISIDNNNQKNERIRI